jgi:hypothetical protein
MQIRQTSLVILLCLLAGPFAVRAADPGPAEAGRVMVEAEKKFYRTGQEKGRAPPSSLSSPMTPSFFDRDPLMARKFGKSVLKQALI